MYCFTQFSKSVGPTQPQQKLWKPSSNDVISQLGIIGGYRGRANGRRHHDLQVKFDLWLVPDLRCLFSKAQASPPAQCAVGCFRGTLAVGASQTIRRVLPIGLLPIAHLPSDFSLSDIHQSSLLPIRNFPIKTLAYFQDNKENKTFAYQTFANHVIIP